MKFLKNKRIISVVCLVLLLGTVLIVPFTANAWNAGYGDPNPYQAYLSEIRIKPFNSSSALLNSFTVQYSKWTTEEDNGLIANTTEYRYPNSTARSEVTFGVLNYGYSAEKLGSLDKCIETRYYNDYDDVRQFIATNYQLAQNPNEEMAEILLYYDNVMPQTVWKNHLYPPYDVNNFDDDGYLCGFISIKGFFKLFLYGDTPNGVGTQLADRYYEPGRMFTNAIVGAGMIDLIAEASNTEYIYDIVVAIPINQSGITSIKNEYGGAFFDIYDSKYGTFYELYNVGYSTGLNESTETHFVDDLLGNNFRGLTNAIDSIMLIDEGGISISLWDIFVTVVVLLVFIAFLKIYLGG